MGIDNSFDQSGMQSGQRQVEVFIGSGLLSQAEQSFQHSVDYTAVHRAHGATCRGKPSSGKE